MKQKREKEIGNSNTNMRIRSATRRNQSLIGNKNRDYDIRDCMSQYQDAREEKKREKEIENSNTAVRGHTVQHGTKV